MALCEGLLLDEASDVSVGVGRDPGPQGVMLSCSTLVGASHYDVMVVVCDQYSFFLAQHQR